MKNAASFVTAILLFGALVAVRPAAADTIVIGSGSATSTFADPAESPLSATLASQGELTGSSAIAAAAIAAKGAGCGNCSSSSSDSDNSSNGNNGRHLGWADGPRGFGARSAFYFGGAPTLGFSFAPTFAPPSIPFTITTLFTSPGVSGAIGNQVGTEIGQFILTGANGQQISGLLIALSQITTAVSSGSSDDSAPIPNPEPATMLLFGGGLAVIARRISKRMQE